MPQFMPMQRQVQQMLQPRQQMPPFGMPGRQPGMMGNPMGGNLLQMLMGGMGGMAGQQPGIPGQMESPQFATNEQGQRIPQNDAARAQMGGMGQQLMVPGQPVDPTLLQGMMRSRAAGQIPGMLGMGMGSRQPFGQMPGMNMQNLMGGLSFMRGMPGMGGQGFGQMPFGRVNMPQQFQGQQRYFQ